MLPRARLQSRDEGDHLRLFDAAMLGTAQILIEDDYLGEFEPWVHYIPTDAQVGNIEEIAEALDDIALRTHNKGCEQCVPSSTRAAHYRAFVAHVRRIRWASRAADMYLQRAAMRPTTSSGVFQPTCSKDCNGLLLLRGSATRPMPLLNRSNGSQTSSRWRRTDRHLDELLCRSMFSDLHLGSGLEASKARHRHAGGRSTELRCTPPAGSGS